ncbi:DUF5719 family protein [Nocardioides pacificus]
MRTRRHDSPPPADTGRRAAARRNRRIHPLTVIALLLPLLTVGALALVGGPDPARTKDAPDRTPLTATALGCPSAVGGSDQVAVANVEGAVGEVATRRAGKGEGAARDALRLEEMATALTRVSDPLVLIGSDALAPGLLAGVRTIGGTAENAAAVCSSPEPEQWFTGVGAGASHSSVLELVNPDAGPAVADITLLGAEGLLDTPALRGVTVPGGTTVSLDLAQVVPQRDELALRVLVSRGRLVTHVRDDVDELGAGARSRDWLAGQSEPLSANLLLGLPAGAGARTLAVANAGDDEVRVTVKVVTEESAFAPVGVEELSVAPQSVATVTLDEVLQREIRQGALGLLVESSAPVSATVRSFVEGDLSHAVGAESFEEAGLVLPEGSVRLLLGGADGVGAVSVRTWDAAGRALADRRVEVAPGRSLSLALPEDASLLRVSAERARVSGAVLVEQDGRAGGAAVLPMRPLVLDGLVPAVVPALR